MEKSRDSFRKELNNAMAANAYHLYVDGIPPGGETAEWKVGWDYNLREIISPNLVSLNLQFYPVG